MKLLSKNWKLPVSFVWMVSLIGCAANIVDGDAASVGNGVNISDTQLQQQVAAAIASASDVPQQLVVETSNGVVRLIGSLQCESCGGNRTPGTTDTIQQNLGALVRAVPGVTQVQFDLVDD